MQLEDGKVILRSGWMPINSFTTSERHRASESQFELPSNAKLRALLCNHVLACQLVNNDHAKNELY